MHDPRTRILLGAVSIALPILMNVFFVGGTYGTDASSFSAVDGVLVVTGIALLTWGVRGVLAEREGR